MVIFATIKACFTFCRCCFLASFTLQIRPKSHEEKQTSGANWLTECEEVWVFIIGCEIKIDVSK